MGFPVLVGARARPSSHPLVLTCTWPLAVAMVFSKVRFCSSFRRGWERVLRAVVDYYTSYPLFKDASGVAIAAIGTLSSAVQFGEVRFCVLIYPGWP